MKIPNNLNQNNTIPPLTIPLETIQVGLEYIESETMLNFTGFELFKLKSEFKYIASCNLHFYIDIIKHQNKLNKLEFSYNSIDKQYMNIWFDNKSVTCGVDKIRWNYENKTILFSSINEIINSVKNNEITIYRDNIDFNKVHAFCWSNNINNCINETIKYIINVVDVVD